MLDFFIAAANHVDEIGRNALSWAAASGIEESVAQLLPLMANPEHCDILGRDPLMLALDYALPDNSAALLLVQLCDLSSTDAFGRSSKNKALAKNHARVDQAIDSFAQRRDLEASTPPSPCSPSARAKSL